MRHTEEFWKGQFGDAYNLRQANMVESNTVLFARILANMDYVESVLELGCGTGMNMRALHTLLPQAALDGVEVNEQAVKKCMVGTVHNCSIADFGRMHDEAINPRQWDLVLTKGVLIHMHPQELPAVYRLMHNASRRYILLAEYYNPTPVEVPYRGNAGVLWKRDFAGELMDRHPNVKLIDTGFAYHRGTYPQDDITWFLLEKNR